MAAKKKAKETFPTPAQKAAQKVAIKRAQMTPPSQRSEAQKRLIRQYGNITTTAKQTTRTPKVTGAGKAAKQGFTRPISEEIMKNTIAGKPKRVSRAVSRGRGGAGGGALGGPFGTRIR